MKKLAVLALAAAAAVSAQAQSSVTVFGVVDAAVREVKNGGNSVAQLSSGGINTSRLGFRGVEDLGGGLRAGFWLEHGFNVDTGTPSDASRFWNRRSTVSLIGGFGEIRLGRDFSPIYLGYADFDVFGDNGVAAAGKFADRLGSNVDTLTRADNQVSYILPSMGGVYGQLSVAAGEGTAGKKLIAGRVGYAAGPLNVSVAYGITEVTPINGSDEHKVLDVGASYDFGVVRLLGYYRQNKFSAAEHNTYSVGVAVPVGAVGSLRASYTGVNAKGRIGTGPSIDANDAEQIAIGYTHALSKRTSLYGTVAVVDNEGAAAYATGTPPAAVAGAKSTGYELGIRHSF